MASLLTRPFRRAAVKPGQNIPPSRWKVPAASLTTASGKVWDKANNKPDQDALFEQMEREVKTYGIDSWKWYCHTDPGKSGNGFKLDDEKLTYPFYEKSKKLGQG